MSYIIVQIDNGIPYPINRKGQPDKYEEPRKFDRKKDAAAWIDKHSYKGMSYHYIIKEV